MLINLISFSSLSIPKIISESTKFLLQPKDTTAIFVIFFLLTFFLIHCSIFLTLFERNVEVYFPTYYPNGEFEGYLVPHEEIITIAKGLEVKENELLEKRKLKKLIISIILMFVLMYFSMGEMLNLPLPHIFENHKYMYINGQYCSLQGVNIINM